MKPTLDRVKETLCYDPNNGIFTWKKRTGRRIKVGDVAGSNSGYGYVYICIDRCQLGAHVLAWLYVTGEWPKGDVDHINGIGSDNRISNLRLATRSQNLGNCRTHIDSISGLKGAAWDKQTGKWRCTIMVNGKSYDFGRHDTAEEAHKIYCRESTRLRQEFARHK